MPSCGGSSSSYGNHLVLTQPGQRAVPTVLGVLGVVAGPVVRVKTVTGVGIHHDFGRLGRGAAVGKGLAHLLN